MTFLVHLVLAYVMALSNHATDIRYAPSETINNYPVPERLEYVSNQCPSFEDEPCWIVLSDLTTGP